MKITRENGQRLILKNYFLELMRIPHENGQRLILKNYLYHSLG